MSQAKYYSPKITHDLEDEVVLESAVAADPDDKAPGSIVAEGLCRYRARG